MFNKRIRWHQMTGKELLAIIVAESAKGANGSLALIADARIHLKRVNAAKLQPPVSPERNNPHTS
jgi:hypothetical protein